MEVPDYSARVVNGCININVLNCNISDHNQSVHSMQIMFSLIFQTCFDRISGSSTQSFTADPPYNYVEQWNSSIT